MPSHKPTYGTFFEFKKDDVFYNRIKTYPKVEFFIYGSSVFYNNENQSEQNLDVATGSISLYDLNVNRAALVDSANPNPSYIKAFVSNDGSFQTVGSGSLSTFLDYSGGQNIEFPYPLTSSIAIDRYAASSTGVGYPPQWTGDTSPNAKDKIINSLKSTLDYHTILSPHYAVSSSLGNKYQQTLNLISIPSIFYGSSIKKGSIKLKFLVTGSLVGEAEDTYRDGRIFATTGSNAGEVIGVALYNEGFLYITSSTAITTEHTEKYSTTTDNINPSWHYFGALNSNSSVSSSYSINFKGVNYVETITMMAHAKENHLNFSPNPTFISGNVNAYIANDIYHENKEIPLKNIVSSSYKNYSASFENTTYISKVGIYDKNKNLIAIAGIANPVKKTEDKAYTFKLKLDI